MSLFSCFDSLHVNLNFLDGKGKGIFILGDTNCDFYHRETSPSHIVKLRELYDLFGMMQIINEPTRVTLEVSTLIDHIAMTNSNHIVKYYLVYCA